MMHSARIIRGRGEGKRIGVPTLNLAVPDGLAEPHGIYAGWVVVDGKRLPAAFHWGPIPSFNILQPSLEAHILGNAPAEAPAEVFFELVSYIRPIQAFAAVPDLQDAIREDVRAARRLLELPPE